MPLEMPDPSDGGGTGRSQVPCRFCGTEFATELTYCPRCGLQRGAGLATEPAAAPAPPPAFGASAPYHAVVSIRPRA